MDLLTHFPHPACLSFSARRVVVCVLAGKGKAKAVKNRPRKAAGDPPDTAAEPANREDVVSVTSGRGVSGSAPATPTEAESATNQSVIGSWSRNSLRGSKCNAIEFHFR